MELPLAGLRVAVTIPPHTWFGGVDYNFAIEMAGAISDLGANVFPVETGGFIVRNRLHVEQTVAALRSFRPDVAVSLPNAGYALLCSTLEKENIFRDVLQVPTLMLWDHGLLQFPKLILDPLPKSSTDSSGGAIRRLRAALDHPLFFHYSPDRGHIAAFDSMGIVSARKVRPFLQPAYPNFVKHGYRRSFSGALGARVAFAGNVYLEASQNLRSHGNSVLAGIESRVLSAKRKGLTESLWDLYLSEIDTLDPSTRKALNLHPDATFFWAFLHDEIEFAGNTDVRLEILTHIKREFEFFGNFVEPGAVSKLRSSYRMNFRKSLDYFTELPLLFMNSEVIVDVINLGYNSGISPKVMGCLACGGLVLFDYKDDFYQSMGEAANQIMYRSIDQLNALIEEYSGNFRKRMDVSRYFQQRICTEFSFGAFCKRILADEPAWRN